MRRYFSNFINEKYDEFYEKKVLLLKEKGIENEQPILYSMKTLTPKAPNYEEINKKLRVARLKKILDYKKKVSSKNNARNSKDFHPSLISYDHKKYFSLKDKIKKKPKFEKFSPLNLLV